MCRRGGARGARPGAQSVPGGEPRQGDARRPARSGGAGGSPTLVTGGNGSVTASSERGGIAHGGDVVGETGTPHLAAANRPDRPPRPAPVGRRRRQPTPRDAALRRPSAPRPRQPPSVPALWLTPPPRH